MSSFYKKIKNTSKDNSKTKLQTEVTELSQTLHTLFPDKKVFGLKNEHNNLLTKMSPLFIELDQKDIPTFLNSLGFDYTPKSVSSRRFIEPIMETGNKNYRRPILIPKETEKILPLLQKAFCEEALIGNVILSEEEGKVLFRMATNALDKALASKDHDRYSLGRIDCDALVLQTVILLREWNEQSTSIEENEDMTFWEFICNQYSLTYDSSFGNSKIYRIFKYAIKNSLNYHDRLFVPYGKKYYTTLLMHALSPKQAFFDFFDQLLAFYDKSLSYQFVELDPVFQAFSNSFYNWIEGRTRASDDNVYIKSIQSSSAIKSLFTYCPLYMASFVETMISSIDSLISTGYIDKRTYLDHLLSFWYSNRTLEEKERHKVNRKEEAKNRIVTEYNNIRISYQQQKDNIYISIPRIRLQTPSENLPEIIVLHQPEGTPVYSSSLLTYGDLVQTIKKEEISFEKLAMSDSEQLHLQVILKIDQQTIYDSGQRLFREAISFNDQGDEIRKRPENDYCNIFVPNLAKIQGLETSPDYHVQNYGVGKMYRSLIDASTSISVNDITVFPIVKTVGDLKISFSDPPINYCKYIFHQKECFIYNKTPEVKVTLLDSNFLKKYCFLIDKKEQFFKESELIENNLNISLPSTKGVHQLVIKELISQEVYFDLYYTVMEDFDLKFSGFYYNDKYEKNGHFSISHDGEVTQYFYANIEKDYTMTIPFEDGELSVDVPYFNFHISDLKYWNDDDKPIWHEDIEHSSKLTLDIPRGFSCKMYFGNEVLESHDHEIGNLIRTMVNVEILDLRVFLRGNVGKSDAVIKLFEIAFKPIIVNPPISLVDNTLVWNIENNFIGNRKSDFNVELFRKGEEVASTNLKAINDNLKIDGHLENGHYLCRIKIKEPGFFSEYKHLCEYNLILGDPNLFRFEDKAILVTDGIILDDEDTEKKEYIELKPSSGIITDIEYVGLSPLNGELLQYHQYQGTLKYMYNSKLHNYTFEDYITNGIKREQLNPIKIWFINEFTIALRGAEDDGLHVRKDWKSITDRLPRTKYGEEKKYCYPDYYRFELIDEDEVTNV